MSYSQLGMPKAIQMKSMTVAHSDTVIKCVYYGWMNSEAMAEGRNCNGYFCYEAPKFKIRQQGLSLVALLSRAHETLNA